MSINRFKNWNYRIHDIWLEYLAEKSFEGFPTLQLTCSLDASWFILFRRQFGPFQYKHNWFKKNCFAILRLKLQRLLMKAARFNKINSDGWFFFHWPIQRNIHEEMNRTFFIKRIYFDIICCKKCYNPAPLSDRNSVFDQVESPPETLNLSYLEKMMLIGDKFFHHETRMPRY